MPSFESCHACINVLPGDYIIPAAVNSGISMSRTAEILNLPHDTIAQLRDLRAAPKFEPAPPFYTGIKDDAERQSSEAAINSLIDKIAGGIENHPTGKFVLE